MDVTPQPEIEAINSSLNCTNSPAPTSQPTPLPQVTANKAATGTHPTPPPPPRAPPHPPGANIAATPTTTGNSQLGGNWDIPQLIPPSPEKPKLALTETTLKTYSGVLGFAVQLPFLPGKGPVWVSIGDFNLDEKPDLAVANSGSDNASILLNTTPTGATTARKSVV